MRWIGALGHRIGTISLTCLTIVLVASDSSELALPDLLSLTDGIAWVRIENRREVLLGADGKKEVCGYIYAARVVTPIKGDYQPFEFFSRYDWSKDRGGVDYLVIANRWKKEDIAVVRAHHSKVLSGVELERAVCALGAAEYVSQAGSTDMMIPLLTGPEVDQTVGLRTVSNLLWLPDFPYTNLQIRGTPTAVVNWTEIELTIRRALAPSSHRENQD